MTTKELNSEDENLEEASWLKAIAAQGTDAEVALRKLHDRYARRMAGFFQRNGIDQASAEDLVQDTFVKVFFKASSYSGKGSTAGWLWMIARNTQLDWLRKRQRANEISLDEPGSGETSTPPLSQQLVSEGDFALDLSRQEVVECVQNQFSTFLLEHPERAQPILWAVVDRMSMSEIAGLIGRTAGATREFVSQSRKKLRTYLQECRELAGA